MLYQYINYISSTWKYIDNENFVLLYVWNKFNLKYSFSLFIIALFDEQKSLVRKNASNIEKRIFETTSDRNPFGWIFWHHKLSKSNDLVLLRIWRDCFCYAIEIKYAEFQQ